MVQTGDSSTAAYKKHELEEMQRAERRVRVLLFPFQLHSPQQLSSIQFSLREWSRYTFCLCWAYLCTILAMQDFQLFSIQSLAGRLQVKELKRCGAVHCAPVNLVAFISRDILQGAKAVGASDRSVRSERRSGPRAGSAPHLMRRCWQGSTHPMRSPSSSSLVTTTSARGRLPLKTVRASAICCLALQLMSPHTPGCCLL